MPLGTTAPPYKRKKPTRIITDLSHITQDEYDSEPEASEFDLGTKIRTPKDIMLEELSLLKNKGSKMFKMRQKRVEKFIYENNPDLFSSESMDNLQRLVPSFGGQMLDAGQHLVTGCTTETSLNRTTRTAGKGGAAGTGAAGVAGGAAGVAGGAAARGGHGGAVAGGQGSAGQGGPGEMGGDWSPLKGGGSDDPTIKQIHAKMYISPWEKAMKGDESLTATMKYKMPGPYVHQDLLKYKCFNRIAMPFGGFDKANKLMKFQLPDIEATKEVLEPAVVYQPDVGSRPSFNRTPIGWVGSHEPSSIHMETDAVPFDGETDDL